MFYGTLFLFLFLKNKSRLLHERAPEGSGLVGVPAPSGPCWGHGTRSALLGRHKRLPVHDGANQRPEYFSLQPISAHESYALTCLLLDLLFAGATNAFPRMAQPISVQNTSPFSQSILVNLTPFPGSSSPGELCSRQGQTPFRYLKGSVCCEGDRKPKPGLQCDITVFRHL